MINANDRAICLRQTDEQFIILSVIFLGVSMFKGVFLSVLSSSLFGGLYYYATLLMPLTGQQIYGWRMLLTFPFITAFLWFSGDFQLVTKLFQRIKQKPILILYLVISSGLLGVQQLLFMWAPINGRAMQVSEGYFLLPLTMLLVGRFVYREHLTPIQILAGISAAIGVGHEVLQMGGISWETALVACGFPIYFMWRRYLDANHLGGFWFDMMFILPVAAWFTTQVEDYSVTLSINHHLPLLLLFLALISAIAFIAYIISSRLLPLSLFGLLGYVEPVWLVIVSILLGETISQAQLFTYVPIWCAVALLVLEGILSLVHKVRLRYA